MISDPRGEVSCPFGESCQPKPKMKVVFLYSLSALNLGASRGGSVLYSTVWTCMSVLFLTPELFKVPSANVRARKLCFHGLCGRDGGLKRLAPGDCGCKSWISSDPTKKPSMYSSCSFVVSWTRESLIGGGIARVGALKGGIESVEGELGESRFCRFKAGSCSAEGLMIFSSLFPIVLVEACLFSGRSGVADRGRLGGR
jgi:hypothetical protein